MGRYLIILLAAIGVAQAADLTPKSDKDKFSYTLGIQTSMQLKQAGISAEDLDVKMFAQALADQLQDGKNQLDVNQMKAAFDMFQSKIRDRMAAKGKQNKEAGDKFLANNKKQKGITTTTSGLQYKVIKEGKGKKPGPEDEVSVHYRGTLISGKEFDSSYSRNEPAEFQVGGVIRGWTEILQIMTEGSKYMAYIPSDLAYGPRGAGADIGPNETLIFEIELLKIKDKK